MIAFDGFSMRTSLYQVRALCVGVHTSKAGRGTVEYYVHNTRRMQ